MFFLPEDGDEVGHFRPNYAIFPCHTTLRQENIRYVSWKKSHHAASDLRPGYPEPDTTRKAEIFKSEDYETLDQYVLQVKYESITSDRFYETL